MAIGGSERACMRLLWTRGSGSENLVHRASAKLKISDCTTQEPYPNVGKMIINGDECRINISILLVIIIHEPNLIVQETLVDHAQIKNPEVRRRVLGPSDIYVPEKLYIHRLWWLGHVICMPDDRLLRRALFAVPSSSWKRSSHGQHSPDKTIGGP